MKSPPAVLSVHLLDPRGEEGIVPDAGVCLELQCRPLSAVSGVLATRTGAEGRLAPLAPELLERQLDAAFSTRRPAVMRVGVLSGAAQVERVAAIAAAVPRLVLAPVVRIGGDVVLDAATRRSMRERLYALAAPLVVRAGDLETLSGTRGGELEEVERATAALRAQGARTVLVSGVARRGRVLDVLDDEGQIGIFDASRVSAPRIPGLAAAHPAALSCQLALGQSLPKAVDVAQRYIALRLQSGR